jgi:hypothetical protein
MIRYPYVCLITRESHNHHPPYPIRMPMDIADSVIKAIREGDPLTLTPCKLYMCSAYASHMLCIYIRLISSSTLSILRGIFIPSPDI